jgi:hypothetical protein
VANLTITVDAEILKRARIRALAQGTSVNAILAERLAAFAGQDDAQAKVSRSLVALAKESRRKAGQGARKGARQRLSRDDLHER